MIDADEKSRISDEIEALFENLTIEDVAEILTIQLAATIAQGSTSREDAQDFLEDIRQDISGYLEAIDFDAVPDDDEDDVEEPPTPPRN